MLYQVEGSSGSHALPSWVIDWSHLWHQHFNVAKSSKPWFSFSSITQLRVRGKRIDMVFVIGLSTSSHNQPADGAAGLTYIIRAFQQWTHLAMSFDPYPSGEPALQALAKAIVQNAACGPTKAELNPRVPSAENRKQHEGQGASSDAILNMDTSALTEDLPGRLLDRFAV